MTEPVRIRVLVAEDNIFTRLGTVTLLRMQPEFDVVGEAEDGARAIELYRELKPDVLVVDMRMPKFDGVQVSAGVCHEFPSARILVLTHYDGDEDIFKALKAGARGYLTKDIRGEELIAAIRTLHSGGRYMPPEIAARLAERMTQPSLSGREQQVLEQVFKGLTNRQIADDLEISEKTVGMYVSQILSKLGAKTRTEAVSIALGRGLLPK